MAAAVAERRFLAAVEHPSIVRIYNFVQHADTGTGEPAGYIVMEYVGGQSLKELLLDARASGGSVLVAHALADAIEVLPALGYLHDRDMVYCDFKPDNVIQTEEQLKLIDMGGVRPLDSDEAIYGILGYQAPEIETDGPSPASDLYHRGAGPGRADLRVQGLSGHLQASRARWRAAAPGAGVVRPAAAAGYPPRPQAPVRFRERDGRTAHRSAPRGPLGRRRVPRPAFSTVLTSAVSPSGAGSPPGLGRPSGPASLSGPLALPSGAEVVAGLPRVIVDKVDAAAGYLATFAGLSPAQRVVDLANAVRPRTLA